MIFNFGWIALAFVWFSGILMGHGICALYDGSSAAKVYIPVSLLLAGGLFLQAKIIRS